MKKLLALLIVAGFAVGTIGCSGSTTSAPKETKSPPKPTHKEAGTEKIGGTTEKATEKTTGPGGTTEKETHKFTGPGGTTEKATEKATSKTTSKATDK